MKIIIVDDNKSIRDVLRAICEGEGHQVVAELGDGVGLLDLVKNQRPDVVCLDFNLPGADGLELLVQMDVTANMVDVIMITGSDDPELKGHAADLGAAGFIQKPFQNQQVIDELKAIQETRRIAARAAQTPTAVEVAEVIPAKAVATEPEAPAKTAPAMATTVATNVPAGLPVFPRTAVVVDDSGSIRLLLKGILEEMGIKVVGLAANGRDGAEIVKKTRPALVCLDVDMPNMTGLEALPHVRAASPQTKVVMITGNASRPVVEAAVAGGARGYFLKPIRPAKVEEFIQKLLQR
jgi:DNA-binding NtrC family response regulator